jgi:hypothetical protein
VTYPRHRIWVAVLREPRLIASTATWMLPDISGDSETDLPRHLSRLAARHTCVGIGELASEDSLECLWRVAGKAAVLTLAC